MKEYFNLDRLLAVEEVSSLVYTAYTALFSECPVERSLAVEGLKSSSDNEFKIKAVHSSDGQIIFDMHCSQIGAFRAYGGARPSSYEHFEEYKSLRLD